MIIKIKDTDQFFKILSEHMDLDEYSYKYLKKVLTMIRDRQVSVSPDSFIMEEKDCWLLFIETKLQLFMYGKNYSDDQVSHYAALVKLKPGDKVEIMGKMDLVYAVLKKSGIENYKRIKDRCFYHLVEYKGNPNGSSIQLAELIDVDELLLMFQNYYDEEYNGERNKTQKELKPQILRDIHEDSLYIIKQGNKIAAFCTIIDPDIGIIFTKKGFRGQGVGKKLLEYCSSELFQDNGIVYIMTDMHNPASNKICQQIGYELIYTHTNIKLQ